MNPELIERAKAITRFKKDRYLMSLSEDDFRDKVVRPLFLRRGLSDGRDYCGPLEAGKDVIFISHDPLGLTDVYAVQTKKGHINLGCKADRNLIAAITQLKTACETTVTLIKTKEKKRPAKVFLCTSGKINDNARHYICDDIKDPRITFMDKDDLIPEIDIYYPELWFDIDARVMPYLRALQAGIEKNTQLFTKGELVTSNLLPVAASDDFFAPIRTSRFIIRHKTIRGVAKQVPHLEDLPVTGLLSRKERLILLLGGAGAGKSTAILRMIYILCQQYDQKFDRAVVPVFLRATTIAEYPSVSVLDLMYRAAEDLVGKGNAPFRTDDLEKGRVTLFIDALDELADIVPQEKLADRVLEFHRIYPECKIIITSRESALLDKNPALKNFVSFTISSMSYKLAKFIVKRLLKPNALQSEEAEEFLRKLQEVHGVDLNPLIVTVFAASTEGGRKEIPANITELFKKFTEYMLGRWDETKGLSQQYQAPLKEYILREIAFKLHLRRVTTISLHEFKYLVAHELEQRGYKADVEMLIDEILLKSSLFRIIGEKVEFRHLMLQEFFAGRSLKQKSQVEAMLGDSWWRMALVFFFGDNPNQGQMILELAQKISIAPPPMLYEAAITLGLAAQASYLATIAEKIPAFSWVIVNLASVFKDYQVKVLDSAKQPLHSFLSYYLFAREAIASNLLSEKLVDIEQELKKRPPVDKPEEDLRHFWLISGLIEAGELDKANELLEKFHPSDKRLILGIHLGAFMAAYHKIMSRTEKEIAKRILSRVEPHLDDLRKQLFDEFKTELFEVQQKKIKALLPEETR